MEEQVPGVTNLHVSAILSEGDAEQLSKSSHSNAGGCAMDTGSGKGDITMLYEVRPGPCLYSYGVQVASIAGFPAEIIQEATEIAAQLEAPSGRFG